MLYEIHISGKNALDRCEILEACIEKKVMKKIKSSVRGTEMHQGFNSNGKNTASTMFAVTT